jgi:hypothetical protein
MNCKKDEEGDHFYFVNDRWLWIMKWKKHKTKQLLPILKHYHIFRRQ